MKRLIALVGVTILLTGVSVSSAHQTAPSISTETSASSSIERSTDMVKRHRSGKRAKAKKA